MPYGYTRMDAHYEVRGGCVNFNFFVVELTGGRGRERGRGGGRWGDIFLLMRWQQEQASFAGDSGDSGLCSNKSR